MMTLSEQVLMKVRQGILPSPDESMELANEARTIAVANMHDSYSLNTVDNILRIGNIIYNNCDADLSPLEDGFYDILLEYYKSFRTDAQIGAEPVMFPSVDNGTTTELVEPIVRLHRDPSYNKEYIYEDDILKTHRINRKDLSIYPISRNERYINKRLIDTQHEYPQLVGTLDKCKFVLAKDAIDKGVFGDANVKILERDFIAAHITNGIYSPNKIINMMLELKYDGVSVEATIQHGTIISARSRGDAQEGVATDLTPILGGIVFPHAPKNIEDKIGVKFEAIITYPDLIRYNQLKGKTYKNCRTAISGIFASSDAFLYRDFITLVPLATSIPSNEITREEEVALMNQFFHTGELLRYTVVRGTYTQILFMINRFVKEAESLRNEIPFMYDGVVVSYLDNDIKERLGRVGAVNKYSMAIKFNPLKRQTRFSHYEFTVGKDGVITPMIYYAPVEFYGTIHDKSTGHSYKRFKELDLHPGQLIDVEYVNDVMPYVSKPENTINDQIALDVPPAPFPEVCPCCSGLVVVSESGKSAVCVNPNCEEKCLARIVSTFDKLSIVGYSDALLSKLPSLEFKDVMEYNYDQLRSFGWGEVISRNYVNMVRALKEKPITDSLIFGSLGFTGIGREKIALVLKHFRMAQLVEGAMSGDENVVLEIVKIKGIGKVAAQTLFDEIPLFINDITYILNNFNIQESYGQVFQGKIIRFTGFRDQELANKLIAMGHDANPNAGITKKTDILLVPVEGHTSSKTAKAGDNTIIVAVSDFKANINKYLN